MKHTKETEESQSHSNENPKIVIVRHAHRDKPVPDEDNGISEKGRGQVEDLLTSFKKGHLPPGTEFWSSPKKRCIETLEPLAKAAGFSLTVEKLLDEQLPSESSREFQKRIEDIMKRASQTDTTLYLCSHGDLIPEAVELLTGKAVDAAKGQAIIIVKHKKRWTLQ